MEEDDIAAIKAACPKAKQKKFQEAVDEIRAGGGTVLDGGGGGGGGAAAVSEPFSPTLPPPTAALSHSGSSFSPSVIAEARGSNSWDFFLSHAQGETGPQVQIIALKLRALGFNPWFDKWDGQGSDGAFIDVTKVGGCHRPHATPPPRNTATTTTTTQHHHHATPPPPPPPVRDDPRGAKLGHVRGGPFRKLLSEALLPVRRGGGAGARAVRDAAG